jgi:hypothetical protein
VVVLGSWVYRDYITTIVSKLSRYSVLDKTPSTATLALLVIVVLDLLGNASGLAGFNNPYTKLDLG